MTERYTFKACLERAALRVLVYMTLAFMALVYFSTYVGPEVVIK